MQATPAAAGGLNSVGVQLEIGPPGVDLHTSPCTVLPACARLPAEEELTVNVDDVVGRCRVVPKGYPTGEPSSSSSCSVVSQPSSVAV
jgi:hypothetical protein